MIKKLNIIIVSILLFALNANSQLQVGDWKLYQVFSGLNLQNIVDTGDIIYYLSDGWLYSYDKKNDETVYYNKRNDLSDYNITNMYYNYDKKYLLVVYENSNMDIIYDSGRIVNIPDLKNTIVTGSKAINSADFLGNYIYLATDFGYMVVDDEKYLINESFNYGKAFTSMVATSQYIFASCNNKVYVSALNDNHFDFSVFKETNFKQDCYMQKIDDNYFFCRTGWLYRMGINQDPTNLSISTLEQNTAQLLTKSKSGYLASFKNFYMPLNEQGAVVKDEQNTTVKINLPADFEGSLIASMETDGSVWGVDKNGLKQFKIENGAVEYLRENYRPNASSVNEPYYMKYANNRLYMMSSGPNGRNENKKGNGFDICISSLKDDVWNNLAPKSATGFINSNSKNKLTDPFSLTVDPEDPDAIWFGTWWEGIVCVKNNEQIQKFDTKNSPMLLNYICNVPAMAFDKDNNLWAVHFSLESGYPRLIVLPAEKRFAVDVQKSDWIVYEEFNNVSTEKRSIISTFNNGLVYFTDGMYSPTLVAIDNNGTVTDKTDDKKAIITSFVDQDGKTVNPQFFYNFKEDKNGKVWVCMGSGVGTISKPDLVFGNNFYINRVKVPRNDGTNLADYLLDGLCVTCMAIDGANRKWFGTTTSGVYLVNEDGTEILEHFTSENSYLPDDNVLSIVCSDDSNIVYFGTSKGTVAYSSDAVPSEDNYNNVYAYPNPVRPDYTGYITITGLMDNSLVKIADSAGNVVYSTTSNGGMVTWDGCNMNGQRVSTGVYFVLASQTDGSNKSGCVTKIMIVR